MHEFSFADVACPSRHVVLKLPLRDFTVGHRLIFLRQRNPLFWASETQFNSLPFEEQIVWLLESVYVCAQTAAYRKNLEASSRYSWARFRTWIAVKVWHRRRKSAAVDWALEILNFRNYLNSSRVITEWDDKREGFPFLPCLAADGERGRSLGGPYDPTLIQFLISSGICRDETAALEYPFGAAQVHYLTHLEREGALKIVNAKEMEFEEDCANENLKAAQAAGFKTVAEHVAHVTAEAQAGKKSEAKPVEPLNRKTGLATPPPDLDAKGVL